MSDAPLLSSNEIRDRLNEIFGEERDASETKRKRRRSFLVALHGRAESTQVTTTSAGEFEVVPVRSEIELRKLIPDVNADPHIAFLVPWSGSLPLDIGSMFVRSGLILSLGRALRIRRMFGVTDIEPAIVESQLAKFLLENPGKTFVSPGGRLTIDGMWNLWFSDEHELGEPSSGPSLEDLLAWAATRVGGEQFKSTAPDALRVELRSWLERRLGPAAPLIWLAWEQGRGAQALELALVFEALRTSPVGDSGEARMWRSFKLRELGLTDDARTVAIGETLAGAATVAMRRLESRDNKRMTLVIESADTRADVATIRAATLSSRWLRSAWTAKLTQLGEVLSEAAKAPSLALLDRALQSSRELERHHLAKEPENASRLKRAEMANRLVAWLVRRPDKKVHPIGASVYAEMERLARWYATEGGFVDWGRRHARGTDVDVFGRGANAVVEAVDAVRMEMDRTFAHALPQWLAANRPSTQVLPIEDALDRLGVSFLSEREDRKVLVILMDGMAWAQAAEILSSLTTWGPVAWRAGKLGNDLGVVPVIAHLPTVTAVSRAAFFAGKRMPAGKLEASDRDVDRFAKNASMKRLAGGEVPRLLLRAEGHTLSGAASSEAMQLVSDARRRIVSIVVNAIDSSLKSDPQTRHEWTADVIQPLRNLLDAAIEAGRTVLLASDHGHVPADRLVSIARPGESERRYRIWKDPTEPLADYEIGITKDYAWAPTGAHGVVLLADDAHRYGGSANAGEHGGATLAEVIAPFILIGPEHRSVDPTVPTDASLNVRPYPTPEWWYPDVQQPIAKPVRRISSPLPKQKAVQTQLALPEVTAQPTLPSHPLRDALERSELLRGRTMDAERQKRLLDAVGILAARSAGQAPLPAFAQAMGTLPARTPGLISMLSQLLNIDGFDLLRYDPTSQLVTLDIEKLEQVYGLSES